ncbi:formate dehydrogenase [Ideonella sp.]|uniref:formate dehydrogenase n=1 Tax=Ideonella sp. TaxID=1929293 RepID=UPI003BB684B9
MSDSRKTPALSRRTVFAGAGTAGALAAAAALLPRAEVPPPEAVADAKQPGGEGGYRATAHVLRYYQTAKV